MTDEEQQARDTLLAKATLLGFNMHPCGRHLHDGCTIIISPQGFKFVTGMAEVLNTWLHVRHDAPTPGYYDKLLAEFDLGLRGFYDPEDRT